MWKIMPLLVIGVVLSLGTGCAYYGPYGQGESGMEEVVKLVENRDAVEYSYWSIFGFVGGGKIRVEGKQ